MAERVNDYHDGNRYFQDRFDTRRLADRVASLTRDRIDDSARELIERADMFSGGTRQRLSRWESVFSGSIRHPTPR